MKHDIQAAVLLHVHVLVSCARANDKVGALTALKNQDGAILRPNTEVRCHPSE
jgi:hypothetical protein